MDRCSIPRLKSFGAWSEQTSSSGKRYYYNKETEVSQWEKPSEWREAEKKMERTPQKRPLNSGTENAKLGTGNISTVPSNTVTKLAVNNSTSQRNSSSTTGSGHNTPSQVHNSSKASNRVAHDSSTHSSSNNARTTERHRADTSTKSLSNSHSHAKNGGGSHGASNSPSLRTASAASPNSVKPLSAVKVAPVLKAVPAAQSSPNATRSPAPFPTSVKSESASALKSSPKDSTGGGTKRKTSTPSNGSLSGLPAPIIVTRIGFPTTGFAGMFNGCETRHNDDSFLSATTHSSPTTTSAPPKASPPSAVSANATTCAPSTSAPTPPTITTTAKPLLAGLNGRNGQGHHLAGVKSEDRPNEASAPEGPPLKQAKRTLEHYEAVHASLPSTSSFVALEARYAKYYRPDLISFRRNWSGDQHLDNARRFADRVHKQKLQLASIDNEITSVKSLVRTAEVRTELTTQKACFLREQLEALETRPAVPTAFLTQPSGSSVASYSANVT